MRRARAPPQLLQHVENLGLALCESRVCLRSTSSICITTGYDRVQCGHGPWQKIIDMCTQRAATTSCWPLAHRFQPARQPTPSAAWATDPSLPVTSPTYPNRIRRLGRRSLCREVDPLNRVPIAGTRLSGSTSL